MAKQSASKKKPGFFARLWAALDKHLEQKAKAASCCGNASAKNKGKSCC